MAQSLVERLANLELPEKGSLDEKSTGRIIYTIKSVFKDSSILRPSADNQPQETKDE